MSGVARGVSVAAPTAKVRDASIRHFAYATNDVHTRNEMPLRARLVMAMLCTLTWSVQKGFGIMCDILLVEDEDPLRTALIEILTKEGYEVHGVQNGSFALDWLQRASVHLLITDLFMPEVDGIELIWRVRSTWPDMPVIATSGGGRYFEKADESRMDLLATAQLMGAAAIFEKPLPIVPFLATIEDLVAGQGQAASKSQHVCLQFQSPITQTDATFPGQSVYNTYLVPPTWQ